MKDIEFRGLMVVTKEWVYGYYIKNSEGRSFIVHDLSIDKIGNPSNAKPSILTFEVDPETVGMYTGLKDKNHTKIFGGDIIKTIYEKPYVVTYTDCGYGLEGHVFQETLTYLFRNKCNIEVIGNKFQNSELLQQV